MTRTVAFAVIVIMLCAAAWQEPGFAQSTTTTAPKLDRPRWLVGDHYTWRIQTSRKEDFTEEWTVAHQGDFEGTSAYYVHIVTPSKKSSRTNVYDLDLALIGGEDEKGAVAFRRQISWLRWPLVVGAKAWKVEGLREHATSSGRQSSRFTGNVAVVGQERITAGTVSYNTLHVRFVWRDSPAQAHSQSGQEDFWFSSQVPIFVRYKQDLDGFSEEGTLTTHALAERVVSLHASAGYELAQRAASVNIVVTVDPRQIAPGKSTDVHIGLVDVTGRPYEATTNYVLNITLTTLSDLYLAKRTWVQQELRADGVRSGWPPPDRAIALDPVGSKEDLERWQLPEKLRARLALQIDTPLRKSAIFELTSQKPTEFFLVKQQKGSPGYSFQFVPHFASGTFFVFAEIRGKIPARAVVRVQQAQLPNPFVVHAADSPAPALTFQHATTVRPSPPLRKPAFDFDLASTPPLDRDCSVLLSIKEGPVAFQYLPPFAQTKRIDLPASSAVTSFRVYVRPDADTLGTLEQVRIVATPDRSCGLASATKIFQLPPRFPSDVNLTVSENLVLGNGRQFVELTANVFDEVGGFLVPPGRQVALWLVVNRTRGPGQWLMSGGNPKQLAPGEPATATWDIKGTGDLWAEVQPSAIVDGATHSFPPYKHPLVFVFPYYYFALCLVSLLPPLLYGKTWHYAVLAYFVSLVYLVGGFFSALSDSAVSKAFPLKILSLPLSFWPAALVVCLAVGVLFALGGKWIFTAAADDAEKIEGNVSDGGRGAGPD